MEKQLGKITAASFGFGGYQNAQMGLWLSLSFNSSGVVAQINGGWSLKVEHSQHCKWTEEQRDAGYAKMIREVQEVMMKAKVEEVHQLVGKPIEAVFGGNMLESWRVLEEVL